ncbi:MAG: glutamate racemase [Patescibacteria group bacterium]|jgi:glutamate racemase
MIGLFDSGYGGLAITKEFIKQYPGYSYVYLGDNARAPYGSRPPEEIFEFTRQGVEFLLEKGCPLVILACNTASANALRKIQQEVLPARWPDRKVLGIIVPTIEQITGVDWNATHSDEDATQTVAVLATEMTVKSGAYTNEIKKRAPNMVVVQQACPAIVPLLENGEREKAVHEMRKYLGDLEENMAHVHFSWPPDSLVLGCTHYELIAEEIKKMIPTGVHVYLQSQIIAAGLAQYLARHPEVEERIEKTGARTFYTTGDPALVTGKANMFMDPAPNFEKAIL